MKKMEWHNYKIDLPNKTGLYILSYKRKNQNHIE